MKDLPESSKLAGSKRERVWGEHAKLGPQIEASLASILRLLN